MRCNRTILWLAIGGWMFAVPVTKANAFILINEILADPPSGIAGDANKDGTGSNTQDEFIELLNTGFALENISGWSLSDSLSVRHVFPDNTSIDPGEYLAIFGGGFLVNLIVDAQVASSGGLSLNNSSDTISLFRHDQSLADQVVYDNLANHDQSIVRMPDGEGAFVLHAGISQASGKRFSPGTSIEGEDSLRVNVPGIVPEAPTSLYILFGFCGFLMLNQLRKAVFN